MDILWISSIREDFAENLLELAAYFTMMKHLLLLAVLPFLEAFAPTRFGSGVAHQQLVPVFQYATRYTTQHAQRGGVCNMIDQKRRKQLGISEDEDEYDLDVALSANTDAGITKIIAGSFILVMIALLVVGLVIPSITDYGDGVCSPIQNGGRC